MNRRVRRWVTIGSLPAGLLLVELGIRVAGLRPAPFPQQVGSVTRRVPKRPELVYENKPGGRAVIEYRDAVGAEPRRVVMRTNKQAMRGPVLPAKSDTLRIACVGDSHTFGYGVADGETWPAHLRDLWRDSGEAVEVINAGVNAYNTLQEVIWYERRVAALKPDVVVLQYFMNDTVVRGAGGGDSHQDLLVEWSHPRRGGGIGWLRRRWQTLDLVLDGIFRRRSLRHYADVRTVLHSPDSPGWQEVRAALRRLRDRCRRDGIAFYVALYPYLVEEGDGLRSDKAFTTVAAFCESEGIECLDTTAALIAAGGASLRISAQDYHGNGEAHRAFAKAVFDWFRPLLGR